MKQSENTTKLSKQARRNIIILTLVFSIVLCSLCIAYGYWNDNQKLLGKFINVATECGLENVTANIDMHRKVSIQCDNFGPLSSPDKLKKLEAIGEKVALEKETHQCEWGIVSDGDYYEMKKFYGAQLYKNGVCAYIPVYENVPSTPSSSSSVGNRKKAKKTCPLCKGTGKVRYYVGGSALEAALNGYEDFYMGPCSSCGGTGYYYE